jgi:hypothetical protein
VADALARAQPAVATRRASRSERSSHSGRRSRPPTGPRSSCGRSGRGQGNGGRRARGGWRGVAGAQVGRLRSQPAQRPSAATSALGARTATRAIASPRPTLLLARAGVAPVGHSIEVRLNESSRCTEESQNDSTPSRLTIRTRARTRVLISHTSVRYLRDTWAAGRRMQAHARRCEWFVPSPERSRHPSRAARGRLRYR